MLILFFLMKSKNAYIKYFFLDDLNYLNISKNWARLVKMSRG